MPDAVDNCITAPNPDQDDSDGDLCGNQCDADYNQDSMVSILDFGNFQTCFAGAVEGVCDHSPEILDGIISILDFGVFRRQFDRGSAGAGPERRLRRPIDARADAHTDALARASVGWNGSRAAIGNGPLPEIEL